MTTTRNRYGEEVEASEVDPDWHDPRCRNGWLSPVDADTAVPCLACRPHLNRPSRRR